MIKVVGYCEVNWAQDIELLAPGSFLANFPLVLDQ